MKFAIYRNKRIGNLTSRLVFEHEDFINHNEAIPSYVKPRIENGKYIPIEVNSIGGYTIHIKDEPVDSAVEFFEYRETDTPYKNPLSFEEEVVINDQNFDCGWISPEGDTYWCEPRCHSVCADIIADYFYDRGNGERVLEDKGWIKVYHQSEIEATPDINVWAPNGVFFSENIPSNAQISTLKKIKRYDENTKGFIVMLKSINTTRNELKND